MVSGFVSVKALEDKITSIPHDGIYMIVSNNSQWSFTPKTMQVNTDNLMIWADKNEASNAHYWMLTANGDGSYTMQNGEGKYISKYVTNLTDDLYYFNVDATASTNTLNTTFDEITGSEGIYKISIDGRVIYANGANWSAGSGNVHGWDAGDAGTRSAWTIHPISTSEYDVYNVVVDKEGLIHVDMMYEGGAVIGAQKAYHGGFLVVEKGTTPTITGIPVPGIHFEQSVIEGKTITIKYSESPFSAEYMNWLDNLEEKVTASEKYGSCVGCYPEMNTQAARVALDAAKERLEEAEADGGTPINAADIAALKQEIETLESSKISFEDNAIYMIVSNNSQWSTTPKTMQINTDNLMIWADKNEASNVHYWKVTADGDSYTMQNGKGKYIGKYATNPTDGLYYFEIDATSSADALKTTFNEFAGSTGVHQICIAEKVTYANGANYSAGSGNVHGWDAGGAGTRSAWTIHPVSAELDVYNVNVVLGDGVPAELSDVVLTYNGDNAINGGFFVVANGTTEETLKTAVAVPSIENCDSEINVSEGDITVTYSIRLEAYVAILNGQINEANEILAKTGVGFPEASSETRAELNVAITVAEEADKSTHANVTAAIEALQTAVDAYKAAPVQMPEDGHAYVLVNVFSDTQKKALCYDAAGTLANDFDGTVEGIALSYVYICHKTTDGKYIFVNSDNNGTYLAINTANENKGYTDAYDAANSPLDLEKGVRFGTLTISSDGQNFVSEYDGEGSSDFLFMEYTSSRNKITFTNMNDEGFYVATYSAPYPTVIPDGVTAYAIAGIADDIATTIGLQGEGTAIPANTGVFLAARSAIEPQYMAPAADEIEKTLPEEGNWLQATPYVVKDGERAYSLSRGSIGVGFYRLSIGYEVASYRACMVVPAVFTRNFRISFNFNDVELTGIESIDTEKTAIDNEVIYDLSGRVVLNPVKGGFYIRNGVKFVQQ